MNVVENELAVEKQFPKFIAGDTITVHYKIKEGNKERIQQFRGVVIQRSGSSHTATFTVRKMSGNVGVERIFPVSSPFIDKIEVNKHGKVRRARIFYLRNLTGKKARIKERNSKQEQIFPYQIFSIISCFLIRASSMSLSALISACSIS